MRTITPAPDRFWPKVQKTETCWLWTAALDGHGYGAFRVSPRSTDGMVKAHRFAYDLVVGAIPAGLELDHLCRVRHCVNPAHLEPVTREVNGQRGESLPAQNARRSHCIHGHELAPRKPGARQRRCPTCQRLARERTNARPLAS